jgi:hypothetical protein
MDHEQKLLNKILQLDEDLKQWFGKGPTGSSTGSGGKGKSPVRVSYKEELREVFTINDKNKLKKDLILFLDSEFRNDNLKSLHQGLSTTEFKTQDWIEPMADDLINRLIQYFETIRGQTERDL